MITFKQKGDFSKSFKFFESVLEIINLGIFDKYGKRGVEALSAATPMNTGKTAVSWKYDIVRENGSVSIIWSNTNVNDGVNIALILQNGHGTRSGTYISGIDYINPALYPIFEDMSNELWKEVQSA